MAFGAINAVLSGNPITAAFQVFQQILALTQGDQLLRLLREVRFYRTTLQSMRERGLFASQTQRRLVESRAIWQEIGWAEPAEVPPLFVDVPPGATNTVKGEWPPRQLEHEWLERGLGREAFTELRSPSGAHWGFQARARPGLPIDTMLGVGQLGTWRRDFPPDALARAQAAQPRQYLGPRPLAGAEMEARRRAFAAGGGSVSTLWRYHLEDQAAREGRRVRTWTGAGWIGADPNKPIDLDEPYSEAYHGGLFRAGRFLDNRFGASTFVSPNLTGRAAMAVADFLGERPGPAVSAGFNLTPETARRLGARGIRNLPQLTEALL